MVAAAVTVADAAAARDDADIDGSRATARAAEETPCERFRRCAPQRVRRSSRDGHEAVCCEKMRVERDDASVPQAALRLCGAASSLRPVAQVHAVYDVSLQKSVALYFQRRFRRGYNISLFAVLSATNTSFTPQVSQIRCRASRRFISSGFVRRACRVAHYFLLRGNEADIPYKIAESQSDRSEGCHAQAG